MNKKRYNIAVLIGGVHTYFPQHILRGIREAAKELNVNVNFFLAGNTNVFFQNMLGKDIGNVYDYQLNSIYDYSLLSGMDGIIISYGTIGIYLEEKYRDPETFISRYNSVPAVVLTETKEIPNSHYLISDNYQGIRMVMNHLIREHGYKKILYLSGPENNNDAGERKRAYLDAMEEAGLPFDRSMMATGDFYEFVDDQVEMLLDANPDAEAIVFANDEMTLAGYRVCARRGLVVGKNIAITGYDDCELASSMKPPLTTVSQDGMTMGRQAVIDLIDRIEGREVYSKKTPVKYIQRESCGCLPVEDTKRESQEFLCRKYKHLKDKIAHMNKESLDFQRKSWFIPFFSRDLNNYVEDDEQFCRQVMVNLKRISSGNMFLFLHDVPVHYDCGKAWNPPERMYLASSLRDGEIVSYHPYARPLVNREHTMAEYMNDGRLHQYTIFLLFSSEYQYGVFACDISQSDFSFFHMISLQLGLILQYHEISKIEIACRIEMYKDMERMQKRNKELDIISGFDALTGLSNLRGFMEKIEKIRPSNGMCHAYMVYADLDHLKEINDTWGHPEGNFAIESAGQILRKCLRDSDVIGRIGGDEFLALALTDAETFESSLRARVAKACQELNDASGKPYYVELSLGIVDFDYSPESNIQTIISRADSKLYEYKKIRKKSVNRTLYQMLM